ncbi:MAG TPA: PaaI family thioesterase [Spirochaetota bacterium]|nr:PaaI family thioesterase [Spirochaetota bacterium]HPJ40612.1 PaaI family thioesterase [Spirochaetota bacterium]HPQ55229.1 PaaI family thioesterase [Spirochaetota bacterium]
MIEFEDKTCFGCGAENEHGLQLKLKFDEDTKTAYGDFTAHQKLEGPPNIIHAGVIAALLDETMITVNKYLDFMTLTGEITIRYLQPAYIHENLYIRGWYVKKNKKIIENRAEIENEMGKIVARAKGKYLEVDEIPQPE